MKCPAATLVVCLALGACSSDWTARLPADRVVVTRDDPEMPSGCRPRRVVARITAFLEAFNRGDGSAARFAAPELAPHGGWYSVTEGDPRRGGRHFVAERQNELERYFIERHRTGERMRLLEVAVGFANGLGHIEFRVDRRADDLRRLGIRTNIAYGKGALRCEDGKIIVWSMAMHAGRRDPHEAYEVCPRPAARPAKIVACARRWGSPRRTTAGGTSPPGTPRARTGRAPGRALTACSPRTGRAGCTHRR
jgi:hypothetical protein